MDTSRFDSLARMLTVVGTRRRLVKGFAALGAGGAVARPAASRAATGDCTIVMCPPRYAVGCTYNSRGECIGCKCYCPISGGITGGGLIRTDNGGDAHLALFASRIPDAADAETGLVTGHVRWTDPAWEGAGLELESLQITGYGPIDGVDGGRLVLGWMQTSAIDTLVPFSLQAVDAGAPGSGQDTVRLLVGDAVPAEDVLNATAVPSGFSYTFQGTLANGDLSLLNLGLGGESVPGTPVP